MMSNGVTLRAHAKLNLCLKVLLRRPDNYHEIFSVMQPVSLADDVAINEDAGSGIEIACNSPQVPLGSSNLAYRAARAFLDRTGLKRRIVINIEKNIPVGAGLGGGSSDAAGVLMGLDRLFDERLGEKGLMELASGIGSDVPFFLLKSPAIARGRGEVLKRITLPHYEYVLINPGFAVSTAHVYSNLDLTKTREDNNLSYSVEALIKGASVRESLVNDLESVTIREHPEIEGLKKMLLENGAEGVLMSGSGPTVFGVFLERRPADVAFNALKEALGRRCLLFRAQGL
jgi:4-diphosphocytidyl-2-C-methyl-D-erythritol kinase